jgi:hypothetical protein
MKLFSNKKKTLIVLSGIAIGLIAGFAYWKFVGCQSGTCPLTSKWHTSTLFGGILGYLFADSIKIKKEEREENAKEEN